jgi:hypothetical protein
MLMEDMPAGVKLDDCHRLPSCLPPFMPLTVHPFLPHPACCTLSFMDVVTG